MGSKVTVKDIEFGDEETFMLVGSTEADPDEGKISNESPLGQALLGQKSAASSTCTLRPVSSSTRSSISRAEPAIL